MPESTNQTKCPYCSASLTLERSKGEPDLKVAEKITGSIEASGFKMQAVIQEGATVTQTELKRLQLSQELSHTQLRLANLQSEIRSLERTKPDRITRTQLSELKAQETTLKQHIRMLQASLTPVPTSPASQKNAVAPIDYPEGWLPLLFSFNGRINRQQFWIGFGIVCVIMFIAGRFTNSVTDPTTGLATVKFNFIGSLIVLVDLWIFVAVSSKRFHDRAKSGWWTAICLVPFGFFWVIYQLGFMPSKSDGGMKFL